MCPRGGMFLQVLANETGPPTTGVHDFWTGFSFDTLLAIIGLILGIAGLIYTHFAIRAPALLDARKQHSDQLRDTATSWQGLIPLHGPASSLQVPLYESANKQSLPHVEEKWVFQDLAANHLGRKYSNLAQRWQDYKDAVSDFDKRKSQLRKQLDEEISSVLGIPLGSEGNGPYFWNNLPIIAYAWLFERANGSSYDTVLMQDFRREDKGLWLGGQGLVYSDSGRAGEFEGPIRERIFGPELRRKFETAVRELSQAEGSLNDEGAALTRALEKLRASPLFPGKQCEALASA